MKYISGLTDLVVFIALGQATVYGHSNMVAAGSSVDRPLGNLKLARTTTTPHETLSQLRQRVTGQLSMCLCPGLLCKAKGKTGLPLRRQLQMADGILVRKGNF